MPTDQKIHFLIVSIAMQGHINPMLTFAKRLVSKGIHVTFAINDVARHRLLKHTTAATEGINKDGLNSIDLEFFSDGLSIDFDRDNDSATFIDALRTIAWKSLSSLITNLRKEKKFSCVIVNPFFPFVIDVAAEHKIPCAVLWIQSCAVFSIYYHFNKNSKSFPNLGNPNETVSFPGLSMLKVKDLPSFILPPSPPQFITLLSDFLQRLENVKWVLANSIYELEKETVNSLSLLSPIHPIGPLVSSTLFGKEEISAPIMDMWTAEDSCIEFLEKQTLSSVIYISFGSLIVLSQSQIEKIAIGLKNSGKPFLWVVKHKEQSTDKKSEIEFPSGFLDNTKGIGLVVKWCPQEKVLKHKALGCFLTHCGWNSMLETLVSGVPVIAYPEWSDQPTNAKLLVDVFKVGVRMRRGEDGVVSSEEVERCIREVSDGATAAEVKRRAIELKEVAKKAVEDGGSSQQNFDRFVEDIVGLANVVSE